MQLPSFPTQCAPSASLLRAVCTAVAILRSAPEAASEHQALERELKRKQGRAEVKERLEDVVGPKKVGRGGMLEKKRTRRESDRVFREKGDDGYEVDEST